MIRNFKIDLDIWALNYAAKYGRLSIVRFLIEVVGILPTVQTVHIAFQSLNIELYFYFAQRKGLLSEDILLEFLKMYKSIPHVEKEDDFYDIVSVPKPRIKSALKDPNAPKNDRIRFNLDKNSMHIFYKSADQVKRKVSDVKRPKRLSEDRKKVMQKAIFG